VEAQPPDCIASRSRHWNLSRQYRQRPTPPVSAAGAGSTAKKRVGTLPANGAPPGVRPRLQPASASASPSRVRIPSLS
jgi:hypothetical protein